MGAADSDICGLEQAADVHAHAQQFDLITDAGLGGPRRQRGADAVVPADAQQSPVRGQRIGNAGQAVK